MIEDDPTILSQKFFAWEGDTLRGFTRESGLTLYLSAVGASGMPVWVPKDGAFLKATATLRSDRWRVAGRDGIPIADREAYSRNRQGLMVAAQLDEVLCEPDFKLKIRSGDPFEVNIPRSTLNFDPDEFAKRFDAQDSLSVGDVLWVVKECVTIMHPLLRWATTFEGALEYQAEQNDELNILAEFREIFL